MLGAVNKNLAEQAATDPAVANQPAMTGAMSGPPRVLAYVNLAVFTAVQGGLTCWIKKMNKFTEIETGMMAMFGAGAALSVSSSLSGQKAAFGGQDNGDIGRTGADCARGAEIGRFVFIVERSVYEDWPEVFWEE